MDDNIEISGAYVRINRFGIHQVELLALRAIYLPPLLLETFLKVPSDIPVCSRN
jgi:hypothetical protein